MLERQTNNWHAFFAAACVALLTGCSAFKSHRAWPAPRQSVPEPVSMRCIDRTACDAEQLARAELAYALAIEAMHDNDPTCVDGFYQAALCVWSCWDRNPQTASFTHGRCAELYRSSLIGLLHEGQRLQRFDPRHGLRVHLRGEWLDIPVRYHGFAWHSDDFNELEVVGDYQTKDLNCAYRCPGIGVPAVATRVRCQKENFLSKECSFPATVLLRHDTFEHADARVPAVLELYDPLRVNNIVIGEQVLPLAKDKSAHLAKALDAEPRDYLQGFVQPGIVTPDEQGLMMVEPYQPGKIPIVLVHGLLSDQLTWTNLINEVSSCPELLERYQLWTFQYPTGEAFLRSSATLRHDMETLRQQVDPEGTDPALLNAVMVGHSMGGLISKMQIASSGDQVWYAFSNRPFEEVVMEPPIRERLHKAAFFEPSPMISRVVFIGTPHHGSAIAQRTLGRVASLLVKPRPEFAVQHKRLVESNPGTFSDEFSRRIPTSIDLLEPSSPSLAVMDQLPLNPNVRIYSIVGEGSWMPGAGQSDGVVPISSAHYPLADSEKNVRSKHSKLTNDRAVIEEVVRILKSD